VPDLVGRLTELENLIAWLDAVDAGRSAPLVVEGGAGVGKTHLLDHLHALATDRGWIVLRAVGAEFEQGLAFTGLASIVGRHLDEVNGLAPRYAGALHAALGLDDGSTGQLAVSMALLTFLATLAERAPLLVIIDDLHWLDAASASALYFAIHRLDADRVGVLMSSRPEGLPVPARSFPAMRLDELSEEDISELLAPFGVTADVAKRLATAVGGNPLGLLELARRLTSDQRHGRVELPDPLPLAQRLADAFQPVLDALAGPTRAALEVVAVAGTADVATIHLALAALDIDAEELRVAEEARLIELSLDGLRWVHPLARAAVQHATVPRARRAAHRVLADVLDPERAADQIAWHLVSAATGPDETLARRLDDVGDSARRRGALAAAVQTFSRAAQLSESNETKAERLRLMGQALWAGGTSIAAAELMHEAIRLTRDPIARARIAVTLGEAEMWSAGVAPAVELFDHHAVAVADLDPALRAHLLVRATGSLIVAGNVGSALTHAHAADEAARRAGTADTTFAAATVHAVARLLAGEPGAVEALEPITMLTLALLPAGDDGIETAAQLAGFAACILERWDEAEVLIGGVIRIGEELGMLGLMTVAFVIRADARFRSGRWAEALADLSNIVTLIEATAEDVAVDFAAAYLARVEGASGLDAACRTHAHAALATATQLGIGAPTLWARHALAVLELGAGNHELAVAHLDVIAADVAAWGIGEPGVLWWQADHVEALLACERHDEARQATQRLEADAARTGRGFAVAAAAWCRAMPGRDARGGDEGDARESDFALALDGFRQVGAPFERARVLLSRGRDRLRTGRDEALGRRDLAEARTVFDRLGARSWSQQASTALGDVSSNARPTLATMLTPAELRVALGVGRGASNREAADELFLSVKTIDYHLQNIYRKLDVHSRAQLAVLVAAETAPG
jgi:DNA-binding CsgD family transcriptional regulator